MLVSVDGYIVCRFENGVAANACGETGRETRRARANSSIDPGGMKLVSPSATGLRR